MTAPQPPTPPHEPAPEAPVPPAANEPSIWRTLDGRPIPRRALAGHAPSFGGAGAPSLHKPAPAQPGYPAGTPAPAAGRFVLATWWSRLGAYLVDGLVLGLGALIVTLPLCLAGGMTVEEALLFLSLAQPIPDSIAQPGPMYAVLVVQLLLPSIAAAAMLAAWNGQTIGKRVAGIRVVCADGSAVDGRTAFRREVLAKGILLPVVTVISFGTALVANYLWPIWDPQSRTGHDFLARTRVVQAPRER